MVTIKFKGANPEEIRQQVMAVFGLAEPTVVSSQETDLKAAVAAADAEITVHEELPQKDAPAKTRSPRKSKAVDTQPAEPEASPTFLDTPAPATSLSAEKAAEQSIKLLEKLRDAASKCADAGVSLADITSVIRTFKTADGKQALKMSQVAPDMLPNAIAAIEALMPKKA